MIEKIYSPADDRYENGMVYRRAGKSGIRLPAISLGWWHNFGTSKTFDEVKAKAFYAFDHGICHFDLANNYGPPYGTAEENFGRLMDQSLKPYRDELFISSKAGYDMWPGPYGEWGSRKYLMSSLDQSLKRMNLEYVDIFYTHRFDPETPLEETMQALVDIVHQGKALYVGISRYPKEELSFCLDYLKAQKVPCLLYQDKINMFDTSVIDDGRLRMVSERGTGSIVFSPLAQGLLTDRYLNGIPEGSRMAGSERLREMLTPEVLASVKALNEMARGRGQSLAQMALSWLLKDERITSVIIGASSVEQIADNLKALDNLEFSSEELEAIKSILG